MRSFVRCPNESGERLQRRFERSLNVARDKKPEDARAGTEKPAEVRPLPEMAQRLVDLEARVDALEAKVERPH